jgi:hypothetical protein
MQTITFKSHPDGGHIIEIPACYGIQLSPVSRGIQIAISNPEDAPMFVSVEKKHALPHPAQAIEQTAAPLEESPMPARKNIAERVCAHDGCYIKFKPAGNASKYCPLHVSKKKKLSPEQQQELDATLADIRHRENHYTPKPK